MPKLNLIRNVVGHADSQEKIKAGIDTIYNVALASYGAHSGNVMIEHRFGEPLISHDGITNVGRLVVADSVENSAISVVRQASEKTNRDAGDATTLTIVLTKLVYDHWATMTAASPRRIQEQMKSDVEGILQAITDTKVDVNEDTLRGVSRISAGDEAIGDMVCDAVATVGSRGGITVTEVAVPQISSEVIDGFTFKKGLKAQALATDMQAIKSRYESPSILVMSKLLQKNEDVIPVLDMLLRDGATGIVLIADVSGQALETIVSNKLNGKLDIAVVEPPTLDRDVFLSDVAKYAGTRPYSGPADDFDVQEYVGSVDSVYITLSETTLNGCKKPDELKAYVDQIDDKARLERLNGQTVKISVGAPTQAERQELKLRVEDAVCAAQTAQDYGVLPGGGVFLRDNAGDLDYLRKPYDLLTSDVYGYDPNHESFTDGRGVNIYSGEMVENMIEASIVDSAKAIEEAVVNSHSAAAQLLSVRLSLPYAQDME